MEAGGRLGDEEVFDEFRVASHIGDDLGVFSEVSPELRELVLFVIDFNDSLDFFTDGIVEGLAFVHEGGCLNELDASKQNGHELGEFDSVVVDV